MAAYGRGIKTVVIPADNESDLAEIDPVVRRALHFVTARHLDTVLETALERASESLPGQMLAGPHAAETTGAVPQ